ncbi:type VI secretion system Vgr family protein [Sulfurimonas lithotrophica]|uniref:type VI secretion system Vgr family protein n=1 Tax=Sulfurimonas lithotrophica TaxID=2590022 RepID=UPI00165F66DB|nr:type VI secretion system tip protein TssI/VgrG [Sulfurimonas lithotrophica]
MSTLPTVNNSSKITKQLTNKINQRIVTDIVLKTLSNESFSVYRLSGSSEVGETYEFNVSFVSSHAIDIEDIVDTDVKISIKDENSLQIKEIYAKVYKASEDSVVASKYMYKLHVVSPLYYLKFNKRYEIYHDKKASDIITEIFNRYGSVLNIRLENKIDSEKIPLREYTTQYNQSDLEFIEMLCKEEGYSLVYHYSSEDKDFFTSAFEFTLCELNEHCKVINHSAVADFNISKKFVPTNVLEDYYDYDKPSLDMKTEFGATLDTEFLKDNSSTKQLRSHLQTHTLRDKLNVQDESLYKDLKRYSQIDAYANMAQSRVIEANTQELFIHDSMAIELHDEKAGKNFEVIITKCEYKIVSPNALEEYIEAEEFSDELEYEVHFEAIPKDVIYKPLQTTHKPKINSIQTAIVSKGTQQSDESANEIDVDEKGRIRVLFHFEQNKETSCYIRVASFYNGDGYGAQFLPRVNSEVLVSFINGDIDKPVVVGSLYNGENKLPYNLPKDKTKSYIRTHSIPAYEEEFGYNEISFEDKRGEEKLYQRAQKDYELEIKNNYKAVIDHDMHSIVGNDETQSINNNYKQTVGNDSTRQIQANDIKVVEKEEVHTINEDKELFVLKDYNTVVEQSKKTIVEKDMIHRVKGILHQYVHKDVKHKLLSNLFIQVGKDYRLDVTQSYHVKSKSEKHTTGTFEILAQDGISLKCGGSVLTVDGSGIHLKAPNVDTASGNGGVEATAVEKVEIEKPVYNKVRVTSLSVDVEKQVDITDILTFTAEVEVYEDDAWVAKTELTDTQKSQVVWAFVKNNDENDKDILTDNPVNDNITEDGLTMTVNVDEENIYKYAHVHCYVADSENEGYAMSELKRYLEVENILPNGGLDENSKVDCQAILNVEDPRADELEQIRWSINDKDKAEFNGKETITHDMNNESTRSVMFNAYIDGSKELMASCELQNTKKVQESSNTTSNEKSSSKNRDIEHDEI